MPERTGGTVTGINPVYALIGGGLADPAGQAILLVGSTSSNPLTWTITNNDGDADLVITPFGFGGASDTQYHFVFRFAPAALTALPVLQGWDAAADTDGQGAVQALYVALTGDAPLSIGPGASAQVGMTYTTAVQENTGSTEVDVTLTAGTGVALGSTSIQGTELGPFAMTLQQAAAPPLSVPPISVDFVGRRTVLNDGVTPNTFTFAITNLTTSALTPAADTTFTAWFDAAPDTGGAAYAWALATVQDLAADTVTLTPPAGWSVQAVSSLATPVVAGNPLWRLVPAEGGTFTPLQPQAPALFTFGGIVTGLPPGITRMYLQFQGLPGYADGILMGELEKSPLIYGAAQGQGMFLSAGVPSGATPPAPGFDSGLFVQQYGTGPAATLSGGAGLVVQGTAGTAATFGGALQVEGGVTATGDGSFTGLAASGDASVGGSLAVAGARPSAGRWRRTAAPP